MKILYIHPAYREHKYDYFKCLNDNFNIKFLFIMKEPQNEKIPQELAAKIQYEIMGLKGIRLKEYDIKSFLIIFKKLFKEIIINRDYDVIITSTQHPVHSRIAFVLSRFTRKLFFVIVQDWIKPRETLLLKVNSFFSDMIIRNADACLPHGTLASKFCKRMGAREENIFIIPYCSRDKAKFVNKNIKKDFNIDNKKIILFLSRIIEIKGLDVLIKAFALLERTKNDVYLLICGDGPSKPKCEHLAKSLDIKNYQFIGYVSPEETANFFHTCDIFVLPSTDKTGYEGWGLVINEVASVGKPIITTDAVGAAADLVKKGYNGFIVKNNNVYELFKALHKLVSNTGLALKMGKNSRKIFEEYNNYDNVVNNLRLAIGHCCN